MIRSRLRLHRTPGIVATFVALFIMSFAAPDAAAQTAPTISFSASPNPHVQGQATTLTWSTTNADTCTASEGWSGTKATSGSQSVTPLATNSWFLLTCTGAGGTASQRVITTWTTAPTTPDAPTVSFSASPNPHTQGSATTLSWSTTNADTCSASEGWSGTKATSGSESVTPAASNSWFLLTCTGAGGTASQRVITQWTAAATPAATVSLSVNPTSITAGQSATLTWSATNATSCTASGAWSGTKGTSGSEAVTPSSTGTYTLTCSGSGGSGSGSATVTVGSGGGSTAAPVITFPNPASAPQGQPVTLSWSTTNATSCTASAGWSGTKGTSGSESVTPGANNTWYTLTCTGPGGTDTKTAVSTWGTSTTEPSTTGICTTLSIDCLFSQSIRIDTGLRGAGVPASYSWAAGAIVMNGTAPSNVSAMTAWGQVYPQAGQPHTSANVYLKNFRAFVHRKTGGWIEVQSQGTFAVQGGFYLADFTAGVGPITMTAMGDGSVRFPSPPAGQNSHWWMAPRGTYTQGTVDYFFMMGELRIDNPNAHLVAQTAGDWWLSASSLYPSNPAIGVSNWVKLTTSYQQMLWTSAPRSLIESDPPPPLAGLVGSPTNSVPSVSVSASPASIQSGQSSTLTWSATNATSCTASGAWSGTKGTSGSEAVTPSSTGTYTLTCSGAGGSANGSATVTIVSGAAPVITFPNPASAPQGQPVTLSWSTTNATSCTASAGWSGTKATSGSESVTPGANNTWYTLTCTGPGGTDTKTAVSTWGTSTTEPPTTGATGVCNTLTIDCVMQHSIRANNGVFPLGVPTNYAWYGGAMNFYDPNSSPPGMSAITAWGQVYPQSGQPVIATNVYMKDFKTYLHRRGGGWILVQNQGSPSTVAGGFYPANFQGSVGPLPVTVQSDGSVRFAAPPSGQTSHYWMNPRGTFPADTIDGVFVMAQMRIDNANAHHVANFGADWWRDFEAGYVEPVGTNNPAVGVSNWVKLSSTYQYFLYTNMTREELVADPPAPLVGTASTPTPPTVTLTGTPGTIQSGQSTTVSWTSTNATSCIASGAWSGTKSTAGSETVSPTASATYTIACTGAGGSANTAITITVAAPADTQPPSVPASLSASSVSTSQINLSWSASTDNVGVTGYRVYRNGTLVASPTGTSHSDIGLAAASAYVYTVLAVDAAGNASAQSLPTAGATQAALSTNQSDVQVPSSPASVTASAGSPSTVTVSWQAATDNIAVTGYQVFRNGTLVSTQSGTTYNDTGLSASTAYSYTIRAYDAAGNLSVHSADAAATTHAAPAATGGVSGGGSGGSVTSTSNTATSQTTSSGSGASGSSSATEGRPGIIGAGVGTSVPGIGAAQTVSYTRFTRDLELNIEGEDVRELQRFLNAQGFRISESGPGSPGAESTTFGPKTAAALAKFQAANGISPASGYFGPITRAAINARANSATTEEAPADEAALRASLLARIEELKQILAALIAARGGTVPATSQSQTQPSTVETSVAPEALDVPLGTRTLFLDMSGTDVSALQTFLATMPDIYPSGRVTGFYGTLTRDAVRAFQVKYEIVAPGEDGYGYLGPKTLQKIRELQHQ